MQKIWVEWQSGVVECVDSADDEGEAIYLVMEYRMAYGSSARRVWMQLR